MILLRKATVNDIDEIITLFEDTVFKVGKQAYSDEQLHAWVSGASYERYKEAIRTQYFIVAESNVEIVGFGSLDADYIDFLYVHIDHQRQSIASMIYEDLERRATSQRVKCIFSDVSKNAQPFFSGKGFQIVKENRKVIQGVIIVNHSMKKRLE